MLQVFGAGAVKDFLFHYFTTFQFLSASCGSADSKKKMASCHLLLHKRYSQSPTSGMLMGRSLN